MRVSECLHRPSISRLPSPLSSELSSQVPMPVHCPYIIQRCQVCALPPLAESLS